MSSPRGRFKQEVLTAFQKVSPSRINIEDDETLSRYVRNHYNLFFHKLRFPPELFAQREILDFGCGTGEADVVLAQWGARVHGFDFNPISIQRAAELACRFSLSARLTFAVGDVETFAIQPESFDRVVSFGVIAHVPNQRLMFRRMAEAVRPGGFVILGFVEDAGLIQRLLHRAIVRVNAGKTDEEITRIARACFGEHLERSVRIGGRTEASVINDYLVNPHYDGLSSITLDEWADDLGLEFYSAWPTTDLPLVVDSPYFEPVRRTSPAVRMLLSLNRLRWVFAQQEDAVVFAELRDVMDGVDQKIEALLGSLTEFLQQEAYPEAALSECGARLEAAKEGLRQAGQAAVEFASRHLASLGAELERLLSLIVWKAQQGRDFDLDQVHGLLFKGFNGLGTSYTVFHKPR